MTYYGSFYCKLLPLSPPQKYVNLPVTLYRFNKKSIEFSNQKITTVQLTGHGTFGVKLPKFCIERKDRQKEEEGKTHLFEFLSA